MNFFAMNYCVKCGLELTEDMTSCPLCKEPVAGKEQKINTGHVVDDHKHPKDRKPLRRIVQYLREHIPPFKRIFHT